MKTTLLQVSLADFGETCLHPARFIHYKKNEINGLNDALSNCNSILSCKYDCQCNLKDAYQNTGINRMKRKQAN
jgi:hypothetical protein